MAEITNIFFFGIAKVFLAVFLLSFFFSVLFYLLKNMFRS